MNEICVGKHGLTEKVGFMKKRFQDVSHASRNSWALSAKCTREWPSSKVVVSPSSLQTPSIQRFACMTRERPRIGRVVQCEWRGSHCTTTHESNDPDPWDRSCLSTLPSLVQVAIDREMIADSTALAAHADDCDHTCVKGVRRGDLKRCVVTYP